MLGLIFAAALACPYNQHPCPDQGPPPALSQSYERGGQDEHYERRSERYLGRDEAPYGSGAPVVRESETPDGVRVRETWGPNGYVRESWGARSYERHESREDVRQGYDDYSRQAHADERYDNQRYDDGRDGGWRDERGPGVYPPSVAYDDRYGYSNRADVYSGGYDSRYADDCPCDCPPEVAIAIPRETVQLRGWAPIGAVYGDYYGGGGGGGGGSGGFNMNGGFVVGGGGTGAAGGSGSGSGSGSANSSSSSSSYASSSSSASASAHLSATIHMSGGGGGGGYQGHGPSGGGSGGCTACSTGGHSSGSGKRW